MSTPNGGPAFPVVVRSDIDYDSLDAGMSLRDWFAGQAYPPILAWMLTYVTPGDDPQKVRTAMAHAAELAFNVAGDMLDAREVKP